MGAVGDPEAEHIMASIAPVMPLPGLGAAVVVAAAAVAVAVEPCTAVSAAPALG